MNSRGVVSLATTIIVSILLVIIATSLTSIMVIEQRQATDGDQSLRAFYAAQAGVEEAILRIKNSLTSGGPFVSQPTCAGTGHNFSATVGYTCQLITYNDNLLTGRAQTDQSLQVDLATLPIKSLKLSWNLFGVDTAASLDSTPGNLNDASQWIYPSAMEINIIKYPDNPAHNATFTPSAVTSSTFLIRPTGLSPSPLDITVGANQQSPQPARCVPTSLANSYNCTVILDKFDTTNAAYVIRMRPRYKDTHYNLQFFDGLAATGNPVVVPDQYGTIDVTARAGDVYRRIQAKIPFRGVVPTGLDFVLYSDTDICKDFSTTGGVASSSSGCN